MSANHAAKLESKFRHALNLHQLDKEQQAGKLYRSVLKARPNHPGALHYQGLLSHQQGDSENAIRLIRRAIKSQPEYFDAWMNLGNVLQEQERFAEAEDCYRQVIELRPAGVAAHSNLSVSLRRQERLDEAIETGRKAVELDPQYLIAWFNLGNAYKVASEFKQAIDSYQKAIQLKPDFSLAYDAMCQSTFQLECRSVMGRLSYRKTKQAYEQWLASEPDNALARFMLQAICGDEKLTRAPDDVVRGMFDQFAPSFEQHLESLAYTLPQKLSPLLQDLLGPPRSNLKVLDGGCGTGLCASTLKRWASGLVGVDLSGAMLEKARQKQLYDHLAESELTHFLEQHGGAFDLAVYADTLCYFGELQEVLRASAHALSSPGTLLFTLEESTSEENAGGFHLHPHGRYSHTPAYVRKTLQDCGFSQISIHTDSMRQEVGKPVEGLVVSARK